MRTALVHDWLATYAGSEKVLTSILEMYPSPIFSLFHKEKSMIGTPLQNADITSSFLQKMPKIFSKFKYYLPLFPLAMESFDLSEYDVIISSSHCVAKGSLTHAHQTHICYCHTPMRYIWDLHFEYLKYANLHRGFKGLLARHYMHKLRNWDVGSSLRVDHFVANSKCVAKRIKKIYRRDAKVIYPPVDTQFFTLNKNPREDFYVAGGRLVPYKKICVCIEAFNQMPDKKLVIIGDGPERKKLMKMAKSNITFLGYQNNEVLRDHLQRAKGYLFIAHEDFGIQAVEAQSTGCPVLAFAKGGALETVVENETGMFVFDQTGLALRDTIIKFEQNYDRFDSRKISAHAKSFSKERFQKEFKAFIEEKCS